MSRVQPVEVREVLYILDPPKPPTNGWGTAGFIFSIFGIFTGGLLSPVALLMCMLGLRKKPRSFAMIGFLLSLLGSAFLASVVAIPVIAAHRHHEHRMQRDQIEMTYRSVQAVVSTIEAQAQLAGERLDGFSGNAITIQHKDAWETDLRFDEGEEGFAVRSAGPDRHFDTQDDVAVEAQWSPGLRVPATQEVGLGLDEADGSSTDSDLNQ